MTESPLELAESQHGLVARRQLRSMGMSFDSIRSLSRSRHWEAVGPEVLRRVGAVRSTDQIVLAAVLDSGATARLSHLSGGAGWGLGGFDLLPVEVVRTGSSRRTSELARVHRVRELPDKWTTTLRGIPIVRPELLALQLYAVCHPDRAERAVERLWSMRLLSGASIQTLLDEMGERGRNGTAGLRAYLEIRGVAYTPAASSSKLASGSYCARPASRCSGRWSPAERRGPVGSTSGTSRSR